MEDLEKKLKEKFCTEGTFYWLWKETHSVDDVCKFIKEIYQSKSIPMQAGVKPSNDGNIFEMNIYTGRVNGNDIHQKEEQHILFTAKSKKQIEYLINELCRVIRQTDKINTHNEIIAGIIGDSNRLSV